MDGSIKRNFWSVYLTNSHRFVLLQSYRTYVVFVLITQGQVCGVDRVILKAGIVALISVRKFVGLIVEFDGWESANVLGWLELWLVAFHCVSLSRFKLRLLNLGKFCDLCILNDQILLLMRFSIKNWRFMLHLSFGVRFLNQKPRLLNSLCLVA